MNWRMTGRWLTATFVMSSLLACSYQNLTDTGFAPAALTQSQLARSQLAQSQQRWVQAALRNYDYATTVMCYCTEDYIRAMRVNVREGQVASAQYLDDGTQVPDKIAQSLLTVEQWFTYIDKGLGKPYFLLDVEYHAQLGYPVRLQADVRQQVADDERTVRIWDLVPETGNE